MLQLLRRATRAVDQLTNRQPDRADVDPSELADAQLRLAIAGDVGEPSLELDRTVATMAREARARPFDAVVLLGDNVYPDGEPSLIEPKLLRPLAPLLHDGTPLVAVLGNHDVCGGHADEVVRRLGMPDRWYARQLGPLQLIALDSTLPDDPAQRRWLEETLAASTARFRAVALHHPPYSAGWHGSSRVARRAFVPVFRRHGVDVVLAGHEHDYQRSRPLRGTTYVVTGAATHLRATGRARFTAVSASRHHFLDLWVGQDRLVLRAVALDGAVIDCAVLGERHHFDAALLAST